MDLRVFLEDIERRLDEREEELALKEWKLFAEGECGNTPFKPTRRTPKPAGVDWPKISINDAFINEKLMIISQFSYISTALAEGSGELLGVRSNYGVGIIPSYFGAELFMMPYETNSLPNVKKLSGGRTAIEHIISSRLPKLNQRLGARVLSVGEKFMEIKNKYPKIGKFVRIDHPDCQGPFDICELLYGSEIFLDLYDVPELIHSLLRVITNFYKKFLDNWFKIVPNNDGYHAHFGRLHKGSICIRVDSAMNLSPSFYEEFLFPYDSEALSHLGGGAIHFCGRGDHFVKKMSEMKNLYAVDLTQPQYNNMDFVFENTIDKGINLFTCNGEYYDSIKSENHQTSRLYLGR